MSKDPAFLFYPGDYLRDTQCLSETSQVAYDRIMCEHMRNICITQEQLNFFTKRLTKEQKDELLMVLNKIPGGFQITWVSESIEKRRNYSDSRRQNRKGHNKPKANISYSYDSHMENEIEIEIDNEDKGVQGDLSGELMMACDKWYIDQVKATYQDKDVEKELARFKLKVMTNQRDYQDYGVNGLRKAFQSHLNNAKSVNQQQPKKVAFKL